MGINRLQSSLLQEQLWFQCYAIHTNCLVTNRADGRLQCASAIACVEKAGKGTYERTKRSRLIQLGFLGLKVMNLLNTTWATGAIPMGAPG